MIPIKEVEVLKLREPTEATSQEGDLDGALETVVVRLRDVEGREGIGECDAPPEAVEAFVNQVSAHQMSQNMAALLRGSDPIEIGALWRRLYDATQYPGRRGLGIHALSAIDIALHDLAGKQLGLPAFKLLGGALRPSLRPYATVFQGLPQGRSLQQMMDITAKMLGQALELGFEAVKLEVIFEDLADDRTLVACIEESRRLIGPDVDLMLDFGYRWRDWRQAAATLEKLDGLEIYFAEAALQHDDLHGHARLAERAPMRVCGAEHAATRWEIREWIEVGKVDVVQPDINRCGGLTEIRRIAEFCELAGVLCIPHGWKTGITAACGRHFQAACPAAPYFEYLAPELSRSALRRRLVKSDARVENGLMALPEGPGLGIALDPEAVQEFLV
ncbi:MAG: mandelate racemase/muconate lactonizing enzyme family protein [Rhodovibrionaceae bacterium]